MVHKRTPAVVLDILDHGESDKIVTFYSPLVGKISGIAKGAKRSKKRFVNKLELFSWLELFYDDRGSGSLVRISEAELRDSFISIRTDYERYVAAALINELVLYWTRENDADPELFAMLVWAYQGLHRGEDPLRTVILFQVKLIDIMGYRPHLAGCISCGAFDSAGSPFGFSLGRSGLVCRTCNGDNGGHIPVSLSTAKLLCSAQELPREKLGRLRFSDASAREAVVLLKRYGQQLLHRDVQSWNFLRI